jgi:F-type H+-transporting ATPase subunit delta
MTDDRLASYATALFEIARAEGNLDAVVEEIHNFARASEGNEELRSVLADRALPPERRQAVVEELLGGRARATTTALISLVVANGRAADLLAISRALLQRSAESRERAVAEVRSAIPLDDDQRARLAEALKKATGREVDLAVIIDPSVKGGLITQIGDTVIDGSVRTKLTRLREAMV